MNFLQWLFSQSQWPARISCGIWDAPTYYATIISDLLVWLSYWTIPIGCLWYVNKMGRRIAPGWKWLIIHLGVFVLFCGWTHANEVMVFHHPTYRWFAVIKMITAFASTSFVIHALWRAKALCAMMTIPLKSVETILDIADRVSKEIEVP